MYQRNRRLIARTIALTLGLFTATLYADRGRRVAIDDQPLQWNGEYSVEFESDAAGGNGWDFDSGQVGPTAVPLTTGMVLKVGTAEFNEVWINANGFVSLTLNSTGDPWNFATPGAASFADLPAAVAVIAPFYADAVTRPPANDCPTKDNSGRDTSLECDVTYALLNQDKPPPPDPDDPNPSPPADFWKAIRITWGFGGGGLAAQGGLLQEGGNGTDKNRFQLKLLDRSGALQGETGNGDFDIQFNYDDVLWQSDHTLVGFKVGGFTMDFAKLFKNKPFRTKYLQDCADPAQPDPFFDPNIPFACNSITIEVRNGIPKLATYTADVSVQLLAGGVGSIHTTQTFPLGMRISNGNDQQATNVKATLQLPNDTTIVTTPTGVTCTSNVGSADCTFGSIAAGDSKTFMLDLRSTQAGQRAYTAKVSADQYDFNESNNDSNKAPFDLVASADLAVTGCTVAPGTVTAGGTVTVQCTVTNNGPQNATGVSIATSDLPAMLAFASGTGCSLTGAHVTCSPGTLASGATTTVSVTLNAASAGSATVSATVDGDQDDLVGSNDSKSVSFAVAQLQNTSPPKKGGGSLSVWLLMSLALLAAQAASRRRSRPQRVANSS